MLKRKIVYSQGERLLQLRMAVEKAFGLSHENVATEFRPKVNTSIDEHDFISLTITGVKPDMKANHAQIQSFAAETLRNIWLRNRPIVSLHMELPLQESVPPIVPATPKA